jgi:hypothetical protein
MAEVGHIEHMERLLAGLYTNSDTLQTLLSHALISLPSFNWGGEYSAVLNRCLCMVETLGRTDDLIAAAIRDHPNLLALQELADKRKPLSTKIKTTTEEMLEFLVLLRHSRHLTRRELISLDDKIQATFDFIAMEELNRGDEDVASDVWHGLVEDLKLCVKQLQMYRELLADSVKPARGRTLAEASANKEILIDTRLRLFDALSAAVKACQDIDRNL